MSLNGLSPFTVENFKGLHFELDVEELGFGGAIDGINFTLADLGRVRQRDGASTFTTFTGGSPYWALMQYPGANQNHLITQDVGGNVAAINSGGGLISSQLVSGGLTASRNAMVNFGTGSSAYAYVASNATINPLWRWDGSVWTNPVVGYPGQFLAVTPWDNRLILGDGLTGDQSGVRFSDPGAPQSFAPNNYVRLTPNDGESIGAVIAFRDSVIVTKQTKYFVFYGTSTDAQGNPIFNYRTVDVGIGSFPGGAAVAGEDGVYMVGRQGVWRTAGGPPVLVSATIDPFLRGDTLPFWGKPAYSGESRIPLVFYANHRLYLLLEYSGVSLTLIFDPRINEWEAWDHAVYAVAPWRNPTTMHNDVLFAPKNANSVWRLDSTVSTDAGAAISSKYQTGFSDLDQPTREKTIRETEIVGKGTVGLAYAREFGAPDSAQSVTLGTSTPRRGLDRHARVGELLSYQLSSVGGAAWSVNRLAPMLRETRGVGERTS